MKINETQKRKLELLEYLLLEVGDEVFEGVFETALETDLLERCPSCGEIMTPEEMEDREECKDCQNWAAIRLSDEQEFSRR